MVRGIQALPLGELPRQRVRGLLKSRCEATYRIVRYIAFAFQIYRVAQATYRANKVSIFALPKGDKNK